MQGLEDAMRPDLGQGTLAWMAADGRHLSFLTAVVDGSHEAIFGVDSGGAIASWNRAAEQLFGLSADRALGRPAMDLVVSDAAADLAERIEMVSGGARVRDFSTTGVRSGGGRVSLSVTMSPVTDYQGQVVATAVIARETSAILSTGDD